MHSFHVLTSLVTSCMSLLGRLENCRHKDRSSYIIMTVSLWFHKSGATLDGNSVNRRHVKLPQPLSDLVYKMKPIYSREVVSVLLRSTSLNQDVEELLMFKD